VIKGKAESAVLHREQRYGRGETTCAKRTNRKDTRGQGTIGEDPGAEGFGRADEEGDLRVAKEGGWDLKERKIVNNKYQKTRRLNFERKLDAVAVEIVLNKEHEGYLRVLSFNNMLSRKVKLLLSI
jgi:hypothetical protein